MSHIDPMLVRVGDRLRFDGKSTSWLVRAETSDGRYLVATSSLFGQVQHTVIDRYLNIRTEQDPTMILPETLAGPDEKIDRLIHRLSSPHTDLHPAQCHELRITTLSTTPRRKP